MSETSDKIAALQARLENLVKSQAEFQREVNRLREELHAARMAERNRVASDEAVPPTMESIELPPEVRADPPAYVPPQAQPRPEFDHTPNFGYQTRDTYDPAYTTTDEKPKGRTEFERFIGENLISKIGIGILVIGVAIGAKYAIDNNLISPLTRIVLGYAMGFGLVGIAIKLKSKYLNFSSVLISGGMAIMYFITYFAFSAYQLIDQTSAFALMTLFTVFTVAAALLYSRQIIAHLGLVGAYAVPFLLSDDSGRYAFFFSYIAIINVGILAVSVYRYWKPLFYTSFFFTWVIYCSWFVTKFQADEHFAIGFVFSFVFFLIFYVTFLAYKIVSSENLAVENIGLVTTNAFVYYGCGFALLNSHELEHLQGLFTLSNSALHLLAFLVARRLKDPPIDLKYLLGALSLTFATITVPVQFEGHVITLVWSAEAAILFFIGRIKQRPLFEYYSFPVMALATMSLYGMWVENTFSVYQTDLASATYPIINGVFLTGLVYVLLFASVVYLNHREQHKPVHDETIRQVVRYMVGAALLIGIYNLFRIEIGNYFEYQSVVAYARGARESSFGNFDDLSYVWQVTYSLVFVAALSYVNLLWLRDRWLALVSVGVNLFWLFVLSTLGLYLISEVHDGQAIARYAALGAGLLVLHALYRYSRDEMLRTFGDESQLVLVFDVILHLTLLILSTNEVVYWMDLFGYRESYKLGVSIFWGTYALMLVALGIFWSRKHLRIGAMVLLGVTLAKLFLYDISDLSTVAKTIVFVSLGILMLIVSFLYNRYKDVIFVTDET